MTTEVIAEQDLNNTTLAQLIDVLDSARSRFHTERGFSVILDGALQGRYPGVLLMIGRDCHGRVQAVQRYVQAGGGNDISLDLPWRPGAPNGIDERLSVEMIAWSRSHGARRLSLAFAAFPEIFGDEHRGIVRQLFYLWIHLGDRLIPLR